MVEFGGASPLGHSSRFVGAAEARIGQTHAPLESKNLLDLLAGNRLERLAYLFGD
jgi:hypothetical protein